MGEKKKALIDRRTNEWATIMEGELFTSTTPKLYPETATKDKLKRYYPYLEFDELELVDVEVKPLTDQ